MPTAASDVYSLGVVAFEILTGALPFEGATAKDLLRSQYAGLQKRPSQIRSALPSGGDAIIEKALSVKATDRYAKARDLGDALSDVLEIREGKKPHAAPSRKIEVLKPLETLRRKHVEPAWKNRSPEPPQEETSRAKLMGVIAGAALLLLLVLGWYYIVSSPSDASVPVTFIANEEPSTPTISSDVEMPPQPRKITQPPNSEYFANSKQNLRDDLLRNFVGFSLYYPKDWKTNPPQPGTAGSRGKFLDIARLTPEGTPKEQMLVSYYPSKGTFTADAPAFAQMVKETNETLKKILPGYQMISEGEIKVNGDWRAYEVKFTSSGTAANGERIDVWGRRLFIPAARPGVRNGFEITMLATSLSDDVKSVDDVGVHGELASILYSFEPSQNF
jgi:serine/threonine protein kinase